MTTVLRRCTNCGQPLEGVYVEDGYGHFDPKTQRYICGGSHHWTCKECGETGSAKTLAGALEALHWHRHNHPTLHSVGSEGR